jgi:SAM-dependent methyltransferase
MRIGFAVCRTAPYEICPACCRNRENRVGDAEVRAINEKIAKNYDALVYDPVGSTVTDVDRICGLASIFGSVRRPLDVLDIGCGTGVTLARAAQHVEGRLVGTDISPVACGRARQRLETYGARATVLCRDILDLTPEDLGEFDVIYVVGVIYVTPDEVRRKIVDLIGRCLRPGGVVQISYYSGTVPALRANLHTLLRSAAAGAASPEQAIGLARERLLALSGRVAELPGADLLRTALEETRRQSDLIFFHEVLNNTFNPIATGQLEQKLAQFGIGFAGYAAPVDTNNALESRDRALLADTADFTRGQYRYAVFAKFDGPGPEAFSDWPVRWDSRLFREARGDLTVPQKFDVKNATVSVNVTSSVPAAAFDVLMDGPLHWSEIAEKTARALDAAGMPAGAAELKKVEDNLREMWKHGIITPLAEWSFAPESRLRG